MGWGSEHVAFLATQPFGSRANRLCIFIHLLSKFFLLLVNEVASGLLSLSGCGLRSRLDLLDRCASLLSSRTFELFELGLRSLRGLLSGFLRSPLRRLGRARLRFP